MQDTRRGFLRTTNLLAASTGLGVATSSKQRSDDPFRRTHAALNPVEENPC